MRGGERAGRSQREREERRRARRQARREALRRAREEASRLPSSDYAGPVKLLYYGSQSRIGALTREQWTAAGVTGFLLRLDPCHPEYGRPDRVREFIQRAAASLPTGGELHLALQAETHDMITPNAWGLFPTWSDDAGWATYLAHIGMILDLGVEAGATSTIWNVERESDPSGRGNWATHPLIARRAQELAALAASRGMASGIAGSLLLEGRVTGCKTFAAELLKNGGRWCAEDGYTYAWWRWGSQADALHVFAPNAQHVGAISLDYGRLGAAGMVAQRAAIRSAAEAQPESRAWVWCRDGWPQGWTLRDDL